MQSAVSEIFTEPGCCLEDPKIFSPKTSEDFRRRSDGFRSSQENVQRHNQSKRYSHSHGLVFLAIVRLNFYSLLVLKMWQFKLHVYGKRQTSDSS